MESCVTWGSGFPAVSGTFGVILGMPMLARSRYSQPYSLEDSSDMAFAYQCITYSNCCFVIEQLYSSPNDRKKQTI